jgi:hypothetical protein
LLNLGLYDFRRSLPSTCGDTSRESKVHQIGPASGRSRRKVFVLPIAAGWRWGSGPQAVIPE